MNNEPTAKPPVEPTPEQQLATRFRRDTATHEMTVLQDSGLYRHLRFKAVNHGFYWFDLVTIPNALIFRGDGESYVFSRLEDMFQFFRGRTGDIQPDYWSEKLTSHRDTAMRYDQDKFERLVKTWTVEAIRDGSAPRGIGKAVREDILDDWEIGDENGARRALDRFEFKGFRFEDTWECSFSDFHWWFQWACHGIVWGIAQYDAAHKQAEQAERALLDEWLADHDDYQGWPPKTRRAYKRAAAKLRISHWQGARRWTA